MMNETQTKLGLLSDRRLIKVRGADAADFLQGLITTNINDVTSGIMKAGALLSPQGKVFFDFLVGRGGETCYFIDAPASIADMLTKRLSLYKLRSAVDILLHAPMKVAIIKNLQQFPKSGKRFSDINCDENNKEEPLTELCFCDDRFACEDKIMRLYQFGQFPESEKRFSDENCGINNKGEHESDTKIVSDAPATVASLNIEERQEWDFLRIENAIAESGADFTLGDVFAHDINLDQIGGLSFSKGCYIGQEVVSRMHHRGTARRRLLLVYAQEPLPASGTILEADAKPLGHMGSNITLHGENKGLAIVRLDRVKNALDKGLTITAGNIEVRLEIPAHVQFSYPSISTGDV